MTTLQQHRTLDDYTAWLSAGLGKPAARFVQDMVTGIYIARSVKLTEITRALKENCATHATHKRLSRNLARNDLASFVADRLLALGAPVVKEDTRLIVHTYKLNKPYATSMEYLRGPVGPEQPIHSDGYQICEIVASDTEADTYVPLLTTCWSRYAPDFVSDVAEIRKALKRVLAATQGRGMICLQNYLVTPNVMRQLMADPALRFNASPWQLEGLRLVYRRRIRPVEDLIHECELPFGATLFKLMPQDVDSNSRSPMESAMFIHFGSISVRLPDSDRPLSLIVLKTSSTEAVVHYLTTDHGIRSRSSVLAPIAAQVSATDVTSAHLDHKSAYRPVDFRVMTYERLKLLMTLLQAVVFFETRASLIEKPLISMQPHPGEYRRDFLLPDDVARMTAAVQ